MDPQNLKEIIAKLDSFPVWNLEPDLINTGIFSLSWYPAALALGMILGFWLRRQQSSNEKAVSGMRLVVGIVALLALGAYLMEWLAGVETGGPGGIRNYVFLLAIGWLSGMSSHAAAVEDSRGTVEGAWRNTLIVAGGLILATVIGNIAIDRWHEIGPIRVRFYGLLFATGLFLGYLLWRWQMTRGGHNRDITDRYLIWGVLAVLIGSRLGHCLFYEPEVYLKNPIKILFVWQGGLASHGATIGLIASLWLYGRRYKFSFLEMMDRFAMSATMGALFVRLGNFMNSEIVGKVWDGPWAVRFPRYTQINQNILETRLSRPLPFEAIPLPRHPSQMYEALGAVVIFLAMLIADRFLKEKRPRGLMASFFLIGYFSFRFLVEFFKEFQSLANLRFVESLRVIYVEPTGGVTMGQWLSLPFIALGIGLLVYALKAKLPAAQKSPLDD